MGQGRSGPVGFDHADDGAQVEAGIVAADVGRKKTRDIAVEVQRVGQAQLVAEKPGEFMEGDGVVGDRKDHPFAIGRRIVAYCRGPYCVYAHQAVAALRRHGLNARRLDGGLPEWREDGRKIASVS